MNNIKAAIEALRDSQLIAFPTETVYGLGADASNPKAVAKVFQAKGRPANHPLIVHIANIEQLANFAFDIPDTAYQLGETFWPGPLTLILKKHPQASRIITGGRDTIGIRIPNHPLTLELLQEFKGGIVGPSANKYGRVSPTSAQHVVNDFADEISMVLDGGNCDVGIESTILDLSNTHPVVRRHGAICEKKIKNVIAGKIATNTKEPGASGTHSSHYAPLTPLHLISRQKLSSVPRDSVVISFLSQAPKAANIDWIQAKCDPKQYAHELYANLRKADLMGRQQIFIECPPQDLDWQAINDRLQRAAKS